jgi:hypothetical protein
MQITAAQHVSGVLTSEQSPSGKGGYQILLSSSDRLSQSEIRMIESRVRYGPAQDEKSKWQFYRLPDDRPVVSRIISIPEPDEFGRRGRYLAHSLIFSASDWPQLDETLLNLLRPDRFFTSLNQMLAQNDFKTGQIGYASIETGTEWIKQAWTLLREWPGEQLNQLVRLVCDPQLLIEQGHYVALIGNEQQILDALRVIFLLAPSSVRRFCSFDTDATGCEWQPDETFWARGFSDEKETGTGFVIDAAQRLVRIPESFALKSSSFGNWMEAEVRAQQYTSLQSNFVKAQTLADLLEQRTTNLKLLKEMETEFVSGFADANAELVRERVGDLFPKQFSPPLRQAIIALFTDSPVNLLRWLISSQNGVYISEPSYKALLNERDLSLTAADLEILSSLAKIHRGIGFLLALKSENESQRLQTLAAMNLDEYKRQVRELKTRPDFKAWQVFSPTHLSSWFFLCEKSYTIDDIIKGISSVAEHGSKEAQHGVAEIASYLKPEYHQELQRWLKSSSYRLSELESVLDKSVNSRGAIQSTEKPRSIWQRLKATFTKTSGRG